VSRSQVESGKRWEREVARLLNVSRVIRNSYGETAPDVVTDNLVIEAKYRKTLAVESWLQQVEAHKVPGKYCVVLARQHGGQAIAITRATDFLEILAEAAK